jgi:predicted lipoprotein with Yx(FWY)xxD motif
MQHEWRRRGMHIEYWYESQKERDHKEDQDVGAWKILKWILER